MRVWSSDLVDVLKNACAVNKSYCDIEFDFKEKKMIVFSVGKGVHTKNTIKIDDIPKKIEYNKKVCYNVTPVKLTKIDAGILYLTIKEDDIIFANKDYKIELSYDDDKWEN